MASIVRTFREDLNSSLNYCDTVLKLFWRPLAVSLQSYLKTPRTLTQPHCLKLVYKTGGFAKFLGM